MPAFYQAAMMIVEAIENKETQLVFDAHQAAAPAISSFKNEQKSRLGGARLSYTVKKESETMLNIKRVRTNCQRRQRFSWERQPQSCVAQRNAEWFVKQGETLPDKQVLKCTWNFWEKTEFEDLVLLL